MYLIRHPAHQSGLEHDSFPRVRMSLIVGLTGAAGLLFSFVLLQLGVTSMALRCALTLLMAWCFWRCCQTETGAMRWLRSM